MNSFKRILTSLVSVSVLLTSLAGASIVSAESIKNISSDPLSTSEETTAVAEELAEATTKASEAEVDTESSTEESVFNVFDIYEAHNQYIAATTTVPEEPVFDYADGIDVSKWQGEIDWVKVKESGIDFAIIRAGYGNLASQEDPTFDKNIQSAQAAGVDCGIYWYSYATTVEDAYKEAEVCYSIIKDYKLEYPVCFDIEENSQRNLSTATVSAIVDAFCSTLEEKGYYVSIYSYASFLKTKIYSSVLEKYDVWVAHYYVDSPDYNLPYGMWQYTDLGVVDGISENTVDMNYAYVDYPSIMINNNKNGY